VSLRDDRGASAGCALVLGASCMPGDGYHIGKLSGSLLLCCLLTACWCSVYVAHMRCHRLWKRTHVAQLSSGACWCSVYVSHVRVSSVCYTTSPAVVHVVQCASTKVRMSWLLLVCPGISFFTSDAEVADHNSCADCNSQPVSRLHISVVRLDRVTDGAGVGGWGGEHCKHCCCHRLPPSPASCCGTA
jgi:hypothetical protein